uniref:Uncharacterized protein n=1 Tax=Strigamia maritima TaxID=126957 RepID=T1JNG5_STRMM
MVKTLLPLLLRELFTYGSAADYGLSTPTVIEQRCATTIVIKRAVGLDGSGEEIITLNRPHRKVRKYLVSCDWQLEILTSFNFQIMERKGMGKKSMPRTNV